MEQPSKKAREAAYAVGDSVVINSKDYAGYVYTVAHVDGTRYDPTFVSGPGEDGGDDEEDLEQVAQRDLSRHEPADGEVGSQDY